MNKRILRNIVKNIKQRERKPFDKLTHFKVQDLATRKIETIEIVAKPKEVKALEQWLDRGKNDT